MIYMLSVVMLPLSKIKCSCGVKSCEYKTVFVAVFAPDKLNGRWCPWTGLLKTGYTSILSLTDYKHVM